MSILNDEGILEQLRHAWGESQPGTEQAHEEGGFILRASDGTASVERWPHGSQRRIGVPPHPGGMWNGLRIVATFHTHPQPGSEYLQGPSLGDIFSVMEDTELHQMDYEGEYVISSGSIYRILSNGIVEVVGSTEQLLKLNP